MLLPWPLPRPLVAHPQHLCPTFLEPASEYILSSPKPPRHPQKLRTPWSGAQGPSWADFICSPSYSSPWPLWFLTSFFLFSSLFLECPSLQYPTSNPHLLQAYFKCLLLCKVFCDLFYLLVTESPSLKSYTPLSSYLPLVGSPWGSLRACFIFVHSRPSTHCGTLCM